MSNKGSHPCKYCRNSVRAENFKWDDVRGNFKDEEGTLYLVRCPRCRKENYGPAVSSGQCAFCGWKEMDK